MSVSGIQPNVWFPHWDSSVQSTSAPTRSSQGSFDLASVLNDGGAAATNSATITAVTPDQKLAADLQTLMNDLQSAAPAGTSTANADPADGSGQVRPHHHHHREGGGEASAATGVASNTPGTADGTQAANNQTGSQVLMTDIMRALQAYAGTSSAIAGWRAI